ncbi:unnamed protein product [Cylicostephanus goldi]|uniref:Uncharacterized protein n=1 Tax=Cylicostephanus goldi TaxID=71465 RepID=A0A3P7Q673_CYLGO|nr:unnamed protein product [Cylicostephanus goldi]
MAALIESVADGLLSLCATMGIVPIIRYPKANAVEQWPRSADLATMLHHTRTYQALIHNVLELDQNWLTVTKKAKSIRYVEWRIGNWTTHKVTFYC